MLVNDRMTKSYLFLLVLLSLVIFDGTTIQIGRVFTLKPFLIIAAIFCFWLLGQKVYIPKNYGYFILWYVSLFIPLAFGTILSKSQFFIIAAGQAILTLFLLSCYNFLICKKFKLIDVFDAVIALGILCSVVAFIQVFLFFFGINIGVSHFSDIGLPRPESFFSETDWHAMFLGYSLLAVINTPIHSRFSIQKNKIMLLLGISLIFSFGRTAIIGALISFLLYTMCFQSFKKNIQFIARLTLLGLPLLFLFFVFAPEAIVNRFNIVGNLINPEMDAGAINSRLFAIDMTVDYIAKNPWTGNGAGSLNYLAYDPIIREIYAYGGGINSGRGGTNIFLTALFDAGIIGFIVFTVFLIKILSSSYKYAKYSDEDAIYFMRFSFLGIIYFVVECLANNMIRMPIVWVHFSFFMYGAFLCRMQLFDRT